MKKVRMWMRTPIAKAKFAKIKDRIFSETIFYSFDLRLSKNVEMKKRNRMSEDA